LERSHVKGYHRLVAKPEIIRVNDGFEAEWPGSRALATEVVLNVIWLGEALAARVDALVRGFGLPSATSLIVLEVLRGERGPLQPSVVAERCFLSRPALSSVLDTLERRGLVRRSSHPDDRRGSLVEITGTGVEVMTRLLPDLHRAEVAWTGALTERQQDALLRQVGLLQQHLRRDQSPGRAR
jgi:DNA-binding MarR family transcriptional regulator